MRNNPFNRLLRAEAHESEGGGGAAAPVTAPAAAAPPAADPVAPAAAAPAAAAPAAAPPREPTRLEKIHAVFKDKGAILAESATLRGQVEQLTTSLGDRDATISTLQARVKSLESENGQLKADFQGIDDALKATTAQVTSVDLAAARQIAGMGFDPATLPAASTAAPTVEGLLAKMNATSDPLEKYSLAAQINKLESL